VCALVLPVIPLQLVEERFTDPSPLMFQSDWSQRTAALAAVANDRARTAAAAMDLE